MNNIQLRKQFEQETGKGAEIPDFEGQPGTFTLAYVLWLERQVIKNLNTPAVIKSLPTELSAGICDTCLIPKMINTGDGISEPYGTILYCQIMKCEIGQDQRLVAVQLPGLLKIVKPLFERGRFYALN